MVFEYLKKRYEYKKELEKQRSIINKKLALQHERDLDIMLERIKEENHKLKHQSKN